MLTSLQSSHAPLVIGWLSRESHYCSGHRTISRERREGITGPTLSRFVSKAEPSVCHSVTAFPNHVEVKIERIEGLMLST